MPYRSGHGMKPKVPWKESTAFRTCQFTLFPLMRVALLCFMVAWVPFVIAAWLPSVVVAFLVGYIGFGKPGKLIVNFGDNIVTFPGVHGFHFLFPVQLFNSEPMKRFMFAREGLASGVDGEDDAL